MGNCVSNTKDLQGNMKCHVITYSWKGNKDMINFNANNADFDNVDYLLTKSGYFLVDTERSMKVHLLKEFNTGCIGENLPRLKFELNEAGDKLSDRLINVSRNQDDFANGLWELLNFEKANLSGKGVQLEEGDIIRMGKQIIRFKIISSKVALSKPSKTAQSVKNIPNNVQSMIELGQNPQGFNQEVANSMVFRESELLCRICLDPETSTNPFHNLCICNRRMPSHLSCFRMWLKKKFKVTRSNNIAFYDFMNITCDVCNEQFDTSLKIKGKVEPILEPELPEDIPYAFVEVFQVGELSKIKAVLVIDLLEDREITIGSGVDNLITFKHESVSKNQAVLKVSKGKLRIVDKNSDYGTFKLIDGFIDIDVKKNIIVNFSRYLIEIHPFGKKPCNCVKDKNTKSLKVNPYKNAEELVIAQKKAQNLTNLSSASNSGKKGMKNDKGKMSKHKPVALDYIVEVEEIYEESHMTTLRTNNLANTLILNQLSNNLNNSSHSMEEIIDDEIEPGDEVEDSQLSKTMNEGLYHKKENLFFTIQPNKKAKPRQLEVIKSQSSMAEDTEDIGFSTL